MRKSTFLVAAITTTTLVFGVTPAIHAGLILYAQEDGVNGGAITEIASGDSFTSATYTGTYGDFLLIFNGTAAIETPIFSNLIGGSIDVTNLSGSSHTLNLYASETDYTLPLGANLTVESGLSGTSAFGNFSGSGVFQAYADKNNQLLGMSDFTNGIQNGTYLGSTFGTGSQFGTFSDTNGSYSLTSKVSLNVVGYGSGIFSDHISVTGDVVEDVASVPEPPSAVILATGLLSILIRRYFKRCNR